MENLRSNIESGIGSAKRAETFDNTTVVVNELTLSLRENKQLVALVKNRSKSVGAEHVCKNGKKEDG